ncbi:MAG: sensor histidine kinase [Clostridium sp.]|nr:sensor histidine kinase [Clostridium sp.]
MNTVKKVFLKSRIGTRLAIYFLVVILLPTITITLLGNLMYKNSISREQNASTRQMIEQISNNVDFYIKDNENLMTYLSDDPRILKFIDLKTPNHDVEDEASKTILKFSSLHSEIAGIMVVSSNDTYVSDIMYRISRNPLINEEWYLKAAQNPNDVQIFNRPLGRNINNVFQDPEDDLVSISKAIVDKKTGKCIGVILVDIKVNVIKSVIDNVKPGENGFVYIVDKNCKIIYSPVNKVVYRIKDSWIQNQKDEILIKTIRGKEYEIMSLSSPYTKWRTVGAFSIEGVQKIIKNIQYASFAIAIITLIVAEMLAIFFTKSIVNPITELKRLMKKTEQGTFDVSFTQKYDDEVGELGNAFNHMVKEIKKLIELVQIQEKKKRKAEIEILHAQIKPHFLYNTLDTIQWMAQEHNASDVVSMVNNLSNILRIGLSSGAEIIMVRQEIEHVKSYLAIQKIRYEDKLNYKIDISEEIMDLKVLKITLQPLVENAIYHGIKEKRGQGMIYIKGKIKDGKLNFIVKDNGVGIKADKLKKIDAMVQNVNGINNDSLGYGIFNVNARIKLTYGNEYGIKYSSEYGHGTTVNVWCPIVR